MCIRDRYTSQRTAGAAQAQYTSQRTGSAQPNAQNAGQQRTYSPADETMRRQAAESVEMCIRDRLILGDKEAESGTVAVRSRGGDEGVMALDDFIARVNEEVRAKKN